jgi:hypothetical protein
MIVFLLLNSPSDLNPNYDKSIINAISVVVKCAKHLEWTTGFPGFIAVCEGVLPPVYIWKKDAFGQHRDILPFPPVSGPKDSFGEFAPDTKKTLVPSGRKS